MRAHATFVALGIIFTLSRPAAARTDADEVRRHESEEASAIQRAYLARDGKRFRQLSTRRLAAIAAMGFVERRAALDGYRDAVRAGGAQGLEGLLLSAHGALAATNGDEGYAAAQESLAEHASHVRALCERRAPPIRHEAEIGLGSPRA